MRRYIPIIIGLVVVAGWFLTRPSDEKKIAARFEALSQNISKGSEDSESIANMAFRAHQLGSLLAERVDVDAVVAERVQDLGVVAAIR